MKRTTIIASLSTIAAAAALSFSATAQPGQMGGGMMNGGMMGGGMMNGGMMGRYGQMHQSQQMQSVDFDKIEGSLKLTDDQAPAWKAYVEAAKEAQENFNNLHESMDPKTMHEMSQEDRQSYMQGIWESQADDAKAVQTAKDQLFAVLTTEQKKLVQESTALAGTPCGSGYKGKTPMEMLGTPGVNM